MEVGVPRERGVERGAGCLAGLFPHGRQPTDAKRDHRPADGPEHRAGREERHSREGDGMAPAELAEHCADPAEERNQRTPAEGEQNELTGGATDSSGPTQGGREERRSHQCEEASRPDVGPAVPSPAFWNQGGIHFGSGLSRGKRITSLIEGALVKSITRRSIPIPSPAAGGSPCSSARMELSS